MDKHNLALEITRLKMRMMIHEGLILQSRLFVPQSITESEFRESQAGTVLVLEETASEMERDLMTSEVYAQWTPEERALYADELREIVARMKDYVTSLSPRQK